MTWSYSTPAFLGVSGGCILGDGTYTLCQVSYDVGHGPPSRRKLAFRAGGSFYPVCRIKEASFSLPKSPRARASRTRKLYANASYGRVWRVENRPLAVARPGADRPRRMRNRLPIGPAGRRELGLDRLPAVHDRPPTPSRDDVRLRGGLGRARSRGPRRWTCGAFRSDGRPLGIRPTCTSRARTPPGRNGSPRSPTRT